MVRPAPLSHCEERVWRAFMRLAVTVPRALDQDLLRTTGLSLTEYGVLLHLSEAPGRRLRMTELAECSALSPSRMTRVVAGLEGRELVTRSTDPVDRRGTVTALTAAGGRLVRSSSPRHLASVRERFLDKLRPAESESLGSVLQRIADSSDEDRVSGPTIR